MDHLGTNPLEFQFFSTTFPAARPSLKVDCQYSSVVVLLQYQVQYMIKLRCDVEEESTRFFFFLNLELAKSARTTAFSLQDNKFESPHL